MRKTIKNAYKKTIDIANNIARFSCKHFVLTSCICAIIAFDILVILASTIIYTLDYNIKNVVKNTIKILILVIIQII